MRLWLEKFCPDMLGSDKKQFRQHGNQKYCAKLAGPAASEYWYWTTIRNPWAKVVSHFFYDKPDKKCTGKWEPHYTGKGLLTFPQYVRRHARLRSLAIDKFAPTATLFKIEELSGLVAAVADAIGVDPDTLPTIGHVNTTEHDAYQTYYYDSTTKDMVARMFRSDIERGGYSF